MIKYLIVDDEHIAHDIIKGYCDLLPHLELVQNCYDAVEALECLRQQPVDLIFLDLNMPKLKGFEFLRTLPVRPKIIVTTAYREYALEGFELNVVDYLLKPFSFERFLKALNKVVNTTPTTSPTLASETTVENSVFLRSNKKYLQVTLSDILYLEASGNYTKIITTESTISVRQKISELLTTLQFDQLVQVHKSFAVAKNKINSIEGNRIFINDFEIPIGKVYKLNVDRMLE
ncbi:LytR/AlgR family response regulator transcription factor [Lewinella cohaerens]|uniref:LytR/AlgR family response regulator transcription factor n=1 Tax=Lewinella cohaerens TaxID=70995 RepID=UPI000371CCFA|nr:LytTR family DNA-binding domain-containing protein [Lewinella cohaerens]